MLFLTCHLVVSRLSWKCVLPIISDFVPDLLSDSFPVVFHSTPTPRLLPADLVPKYFSLAFQLLPSCLPDVVFQLSSNWIPTVALNLKPLLLLVCTVGFIVSDSLWVSSLLASVPLCLPLWLVLSDSLDFSFNCTCFPSFPSYSGVSGSLDACLHWPLFACLPVWLQTPGGVRLFRYLSFVSRSG